MATHKQNELYTPLDFKSTEASARALATHIETHREDLVEILIAYESYEVAEDEIDRTLDLLKNLKENRAYFKLRVGPVATFLPRNQPLYALTCFVIVPSLMASEAHFRIPNSMRGFFPELIKFLQLDKRFPNIFISQKQRVDFLAERSALRVDPKTGATLPVTDVVIFTGTSAHGNQLRTIFDPRTLFIANGSGHNPLIVANNANLAAAAEAVLTLQLYNQGQDCAAPNAILVHRDVASTFLNILREGLAREKVGCYRDRTCRIGPISEPKDLVRIEDFLMEHREWLDEHTPGILRTRDAIVEPTIVTKPLKTGGNFVEIFAPVIFMQTYDHEEELARYFEDPRYAPNAMYITVYGSSTYIEGLVDRPIGGKIIHDRASIIKNTHLHAPGIERGTQPYGGYGYGASSYSINGKITPKPTLPQRDIYELVAKPLIRSDALRTRKKILSACTTSETKDIQKLLRLSDQTESGTSDKGMTYFDLQGVGKTNRYVLVSDQNAYTFLPRPNVPYMARLAAGDIEMLQALRTLLKDKPLPLEAFKTALYAIPKERNVTEQVNRARQLRFFHHVYQLLFGLDSGPRLPRFLLDIDRESACALLDV